jgi:hypothetical protein
MDLTVNKTQFDHTGFFELVNESETLLLDNSL